MCLFSNSIVLTDSLSVSDTLQYDFNQQNDATSDLQDDVSMADVAALIVDKTLSDSAVMSDEFVLSAEPFKADSVGTSEIVAFNTENGIH